MEQPQTWVEALNISPKKLKEWSALAPDGTPVLVYVLQEGHVPMQQYLEWASNHFNLPVLNDKFFEEAFDTDAARNLQFTMNFESKPWLFPIDQWDGVILVACHEPPSESLGDNVRLVLADPRTLQSTWSNMASAFTSTRIDEAPPLPGNEVPAGFAPLDAKPFKLTLDGLDETNLFRKEGAMSAAPPPPAPAPEPEPEPEAPVPVLSEDSLATELPDENSHLSSAPPIPELVLDSSVVTTTINQTATATAPAIDEQEENEGPPVHRMPQIPETPETPAPVPQTAAPAEPINVPTLKPKKPPKPSAKPKPRGPILTTEQQNEAIDLAFEQLKGLYRHVFVMKCVEGQAKLFRWENSLAVNASKPVQVDLAFPTFFRIISKTLLPYHGYLVDSPAHRDFFNALKITELPGCVTGIPIKDGHTLVGVLVGVGDENLQKLDILRKAEQASESMVDALAPTWAKVA